MGSPDKIHNAQDIKEVSVNHTFEAILYRPKVHANSKPGLSSSNETQASRMLGITNNRLLRQSIFFRRAHNERHHSAPPPPPPRSAKQVEPEAVFCVAITTRQITEKSYISDIALSQPRIHATQKPLNIVKPKACHQGTAWATPTPLEKEVRP